MKIQEKSDAHYNCLLPTDGCPARTTAETGISQSVPPSFYNEQTFYAMEYPFGQHRLAVLAMLPPSFFAPALWQSMGN